MIQSELNGFDSIARFYDRLAGLAFGTRIFDSQIHFLSVVPLKAEVLIVGGGTGLIAKELLKRNSHCHITFIDASAKMISIAKATNISSIANITFIHGTEDAIPSKNYDVVITNFFLDLFPEAKLEAVLSRINMQVSEGGLWLVSDFQRPKTWWQKIVLAAMYLFFSIVTKLQNDRLPNWVEKIKSFGFSEIVTAEFASGFMRASVFKKDY